MDFAFNRNSTIKEETLNPPDDAPATGAAPQKPTDVPRRQVPSQQSEIPATVGEPFADSPRMRCRKVNVFYGANHAIREVSLDIDRNEVISMIGPSGCGKSTFLRCLNRMNDTIDGCRVTGTITLDDANIYDKHVDVVPLRAQVGMVFQKPNPFPKSIYDNIAYGPKIHGLARNRTELDKIKKQILSLGAMVEDRVRMAVKAIEDRDAAAARKIIDSDWEIDEMEVDDGLNDIYA